MSPEGLEVERSRSEQVFIERALKAVSENIRAQTREGVADGIVDAVERILTPENLEVFWGSAMKTLGTNAKVKAGGWLFSGIGKAARSAAWVVVLVVALWLSFGWNGLLAAGKALSAARSSP
jgi:hypothetical protein